MSLAGRVVAVVGGAAGIGRATAELCAERGAQVIVADVDATEGKAVAAAIGAAWDRSVNVAMSTCAAC